MSAYANSRSGRSLIRKIIQLQLAVYRRCISVTWNLDNTL